MHLKYSFIICSIINSVLGAINIVTNTTSVKYGSSVRLTCIINPLKFDFMSWISGGTTTNCRTGSGACLPSNREGGRLQFSTNVASKEFYYDISYVNSSDAGIYTCRHGSTSQQGYEETTVTIDVVSPIDSVTMISPAEDTVDVVQNSATPEFVCVTSAGLPQASIGWYLDNPSTTGGDVVITSSASTPTTSTDSNGLITTTGRLTYGPSKTYNGWKVYCTASNTAGSTLTSSRKPTLNVQFPPTVQLTTPHKVIEGTALSIPCTAILGNPTATTYRWTRNIDGWTQTTSTMTLSNKQTSDAAAYTCTATNTAGSGSGTYTLDVLFPPRTPTFKYSSRSVSGTFKFIKNNANSMACTSSSNPPPTYSWQGPGGTTNSANLALSGIQNNQGGVYTCTATNVMTPTIGNTQAVTRTNSAQITLDVLYALSQPILKYQTITGTAITGTTINVVKEDPVPIACIATGSPPPSYAWTNPSYTGQILSINSIQSDATPKCTASSRMEPTYETPVDQSTTASVTVNVMYGPSEPVIKCIHCNPDVVLDLSVSIVNGTSVHITCGESVSDPSSSYNWSGVLTSTTGTLSFTSVSKSQDGDLTCTATNTMTRTFGEVQQGLNNKVVSLNILYAPTVGDMGNTDMEELSNFTRLCPVTPGNPTQTTYRWTRSTGGGWSQTTRTLTIPELQREDAAVYTCTAQNIMRPTGRTQVTGRDSKTFKLNTFYKPDVVVRTTNTTESAVSAEIRCVATGLPAVYTYQPWRQTWVDGTVINHEGGLSNLPTLRLSDLTYQYSGIYTCMVDNGVTGSRNPDAGQGHVYLLVKSKPVITSPAYNSGDNYKLSIGLNDPSSINLAYYSNAGVTTVTVENGGQVVGVGTPTPTNIQLPVFTQIVSASGMTVTLDIEIQQQNQFRPYEIVLQNAVNSVKFSLVVAPKQPPEVPTQLTSSEVTETTAILTWIRGFHGGSNQTFVVQLSQDNINWNNETFILDGQNDSNTTVNATLDSLKPGTTYHVRLFAFNQEGRKQEFSNVQDFTTKAVPVPTPSPPAALIGGIGGSAVVLIIIAVVVVVVLRRRKKSVKGASKENGRNIGDGIPDDDDDGMRENPMYDTSESASNNDVYAQVNKPKKKEEPSKDIYAMVDKSNKKNQGNEDASLLYSMPAKKKGNKKEAKKEEKKKKDQSKSKQDKKAMGDIYENAPECALAAAKPEENVYDSAEVPQPMPAPKRNVNQDGLLYAELDLPTNPGSQKSPPVIHGLDDMTEYSEVDFTKKAEPLPDSDEEDANAKK